MDERKRPTVSVIIPAFNRERTIGRAVASVLKQRYQDFEIIIVDDGSTDRTTTVTRGIGDPRVHLLSHGENRGAAAARNTGIRASRGTHLAFLDSDDEWLPEKLDRQMVLLQDRRAQWDVSCAGVLMFADGSDHFSAVTPSTVSYQQLHWDCDLNPGTTMVMHRACLDAVGFLDEAYPRFEDWDWLLRLAKSHRLVVVNEPLAIVHQGKRPPADVVELATRRFLDTHDADFRAFGRHYRARVISRHWLRLSSTFYAERRFRRGNVYLFKAFLFNPLQNGLLFFFGFVCSCIDGVFGTSLIPWMRKHKQWILNR